jgi:hypothetical protein
VVGAIITGAALVAFGLLGALITVVFQRQFQNRYLWLAMEIIQSNADQWLRSLGPRPIMSLRVMTGNDDVGVDYLTAKATAGGCNLRIESFWVRVHHTDRSTRTKIENFRF